jgi:hypothetical protein
MSLKMKTIELLINPCTLDRCTEVAKDLDLSDFDVTEVDPSSLRAAVQRWRLYRSRGFVSDLAERIKVVLTVAEDAAT